MGAVPQSWAKRIAAKTEKPKPAKKKTTKKKAE
jgi:hypothetical protein